MVRRSLRVSAALLLTAWLANAANAQEQATSDAAPLLHVQSRLVIEDVLVMDKAGNPVHGLPASAFHLTDNGRPQHMQGAEEGPPANAVAPAAPLPIGTFTNALSAGASSVHEVLLIDTDQIKLTDQMFLLEQLRKALQAMPAGVSLSLFSARNGRAVPLLMNTTDYEALLRAANDVLPIQNHAIDSQFESAVDELMNIAALLQQTPGRKNLLWFAGDFPLVSVGETDLIGHSPDFAQREHIIHQVQEALAEARISIYPIDVRGVIVDNVILGKDSDATIMDERSEMRSLAETTGGRAYMLNNVAQEIDQAFELGRSAYTLSYAPSPYATDESWHRIVITVDGDYTLSYRRGYVATWTGATDQEPRYTLVAGTRQRVDPNGKKPLIFQARFVPEDDAQHVAVHVAVPLDGLSFPFEDGTYRSDLTVSAFAYNADGHVKQGKRQQLQTALTPNQYATDSAEGRKIATTMHMTVPKGAKYLLLVVRDTKSQRTGSLLLQTRVLASLPGAQATSQ